LKLGKKNYNDNLTLSEVIKNITSNLECKEEPFGRKSVIVAPLLNKLDLKDEYKVLDSINVLNLGAKIRIFI